jgi:hypothetical protein
MTILKSLEATPSRVAHLLAVLAERSQGETDERLRAFFSPESLINKTADDPYTMFRSTLAAARDLGFVEVAGDRLSIKPDLVKRGALVPDLLSRIEAVLLPPDLDDSREQADFARAVAWFLAQPPTQPLEFQRNYKLEIQNQMGVDAPTFDLTNSDRWNTFTYWCRYLGYGVAITGRSMVPDPTAALRRLLPRVYRDQAVLPADLFFGRLAGVTPVFEGGLARQEVEALLHPALHRETRRLSQSTSFALLRLERMGVLKLTSLSDASPLILDLAPDPDRRFVEIELMAMAAP